MNKLVINGPVKLSGEVRIPGAKNTVLPILAATVISGKKSEIYDCPKIRDVELTIDILKDLGCLVYWEENKLVVDSSTMNKTVIKEELMDKMRSSIILTGAILARFKKVKTTYPGGCELGLRPIDLHIKAFRQMGILVKEKSGFIELDAGCIRETDIHLDFPSVGATENIMLASSTLKGKTRIINAAKEPEIEDLQNFLVKIGVKVSGAGTSIIEIEGTDNFYDAGHKVIPDRIVASTYMVAAAITGGDVVLRNVDFNHLGSFISVMSAMGCEITKKDKDVLRIKGKENLKNVNMIRTSPYPGFPTDAQSVMMTLMSVSNGTGMIIENIFDGRFRHAEELKKMGADITVSGRCAVVKGVKGFCGARVNAPDLRSGAGLVVAGLCAEGITEVSNVHYIERGYENIAMDLRNLGAEITYTGSF